MQTTDRNIKLIQSIIETVEENGEEILFEEPLICKDTQGRELTRVYAVKVYKYMLYVYGVDQSWEKVTVDIANIGYVLAAIENRLDAILAD